MVFNRIQHLPKIVAAIHEYCPQQIFVWADGPRNGNESDKVKLQEIRHFLESEFRNYQGFHAYWNEHNLGCGVSVSSGITWLFQNVESGIILEDDCLPHVSFFTFCEFMLKRYEGQNVGMISGFNPLPITTSGHDYFLSKYPRIWGWATWRHKWNLFSFRTSGLNKIATFLNYAKWFGLIEGTIMFRNFYRSYLRCDTWDYFWSATLSEHRLPVVVPVMNLIVNLGLHENDGTHNMSSLNALKRVGVGNYVKDKNGVVLTMIDHHQDKRFRRLRFKTKLVSLIKRYL